MTRLIHIGDAHLQSGHPRNSERLRALDQVIDETRDMPDVGAYLIPGDLFHAKSTVDDRNAWALRLREMADKAPCLVVPGNHDEPRGLFIFSALAARWPVIVEEAPRVREILLATGHMAKCFCLPYPTKSGLVAAGLAPADLNAVGADAFDGIFLNAAAQLDEARAAGYLTFMVGHVNVAGSITSSGQPSIGVELEIGERHLDRLGPIYKGLNHIHRRQDIAGAHYPGSIAHLDWGEIEAKAYSIVEIEPDSTWSLVTMPLRVSPMYHADGTITRDGFTWALADEATPPDTWEGCEVRVRVRFHQSEKAALDFALARVPFEGAARLVVEPVAIPDRALRAPEVAAAKTLAEKVEAWAQHVGTSASDSVLAKLGRLEQSDPEQLVREVQLWLAEIEAGELAEVAS